MHSIKISTFSDLAAMLLLAVLFVAISWFAWANPIYTWDAVPYVATAVSNETDDPGAVHASTYELLRESLDEDQFNALTSGEYAGALYGDAEKFASQLNMYRIKPLYVAGLRGLALAGVNPVNGLILLSLVPGLLICLLMFVWLRKMTNSLPAAIAVVLFAMGARLFDLSRVPVPDNLSSLAVLGGLWFLLAQRWTAVAVICLCLSIWIRTNNILFVAPLFLLLSWNGYHRRDESAAAAEVYWHAGGLAVSVISYFGISARYDHDWWRLFYHTFVESQADITAFAEPFSLTLYLQVLHSAAIQVFASGAMIATALPMFLLLWLLAARGIWRKSVANLISPGRELNLSDVSLICPIVFAAFLLLFPLTAGLDRFLTPYYAVITLLAVSRLPVAAAR